MRAACAPPAAAGCLAPRACALGARRVSFASVVAAPARRAPLLARFAARAARGGDSAPSGGDSGGAPPRRRAKAAASKPLPSLAPPPPPAGGAAASAVPGRRPGGPAAGGAGAAPALAPPSGGYQSGSEGSETDGEYATDVETDDEADAGDVAIRATRARTKPLSRPTAAAAAAAPAAKRAAAPRPSAPVAPAAPAPEGLYRARFVTAADLPEGAAPVVMGTLPCFGAAGGVVMQRTSAAGSASRWEACVDLPLGAAVQFRLGTTQPGGAFAAEAGPERVLRARSRTAEVAVRCVWGSGVEAVRVQVAYAHVTFSVPAAAPKFGASLAVVGSPAALGAWAPAAALPLAWAGGGGGVESAWRSPPVPLPVAEAMTWRLAERGPDGALRPEPGPPRALALRRGGGGVVTATWGEHAPAGAPPGEPLADPPPPKARAPRAPKADAKAAEPKAAPAAKKEGVTAAKKEGAAAKKAEPEPAQAKPPAAAAPKKAEKAPAEPAKPKAAKAADKAADKAAAAPAAEAVRARRPRDGAASLEAALLDPLVPMLQAALSAPLRDAMSWTRDAAVAGALAPPSPDETQPARRGLLRVDLAVMLPRLALLFECDEDSHRATRSRYAPDREMARMDALATALAADSPPRAAAFVRVAAPRALAGDGAGAVWAESAPLAALRARAVAAGAALAEARPARGVYRVAYVGYGDEDDFIQEVNMPLQVDEDDYDFDDVPPPKKKAAPAKAPPPEPGFEAPKAKPKKVKKL